MKTRAFFPRSRSALSAACLSAAFLFLPTPALAAGPSAEDRATARVLAAEAHRAFDAKDYVTAAERFARADALVHAPTLMLGLARSQAALGKIVAANESLNRILREDLPPAAPKVWTDAVEEARAEVAVVAPRLSWITVNVRGATGHEEDLHVKIDGVEIPVAAVGLPRAVDVGQHIASATMERSTRKSEAAIPKLVEGQRAVVQLEVTYVAPPPGTPRFGPGGVRLPDPPNPLRKYIGYGALGFGGLSLVMGAVTGGLVISMHPTLAKDCPGGVCSTTYASKLNSYNALGTASTVGIIAGGVLAAGGAILVFTFPKQPVPPVPPRKTGEASPSVLGLSAIPTVGGGTFGAVGSF